MGATVSAIAAKRFLWKHPLGFRFSGLKTKSFEMVVLHIFNFYCLNIAIDYSGSGKDNFP
jgi:hypothetical protein